MNDVLTEVKFWSQVMTDAKRTVLCSPEMESRCKGYVTARGLGGLITVKASPAVPDDRIFVVDEQAIEASTNEMLSRPLGPPDQCSGCVQNGPYAGDRCMLRVGHTGMCA